MSLRKLNGGGAACAYCGFALVMEGQRQCCPAGRDYDALQRERDEAKEYGTRMRREWQRECEDTNLMLQGLGLCPSEYRSEGGSLMLGRIQHALKKREASIVAERDEAVALLLRSRHDYEADLIAVGHAPDSEARTASMTCLRERIASIDAFLAKEQP